MRLPRVTKETVAATNADHDLYLLTNHPKRRNATKFAGTPAIRLRAGLVDPFGLRKNVSPMKVPRPAPIATDSVSEITAKKAGTNIPINSSPTPKGVGM